ncbi:MAG: LysE family translocator [Verrucomicrobiota bacterium]
MTAYTLLGFLGASAALTIAPGPDNAFILAQGVSRGRKAAIITALGMCSGISVHTTAAALGISAALYSSAAAFTLLKYAGAAYLLFLACKALKEPATPQPASGIVGARQWGACFRRGFMMNVVNPKVGLFFLAFLPQFVTREDGGIATQMALLGLVFMLQAVGIFSVIGYLSGSLGDVLLKKPGIAKYFAWLSAGVFGALGLKLAFAQR